MCCCLFKLLRDGIVKTLFIESLWVAVVCSLKVKKGTGQEEKITSIIKIEGDLVWDSQAIKGSLMKST